MVEVDLITWSRCEACGKRAQMQDLYTCGIYTLEKAKLVDVGWAIISPSSFVCYDCQTAYIAEHIFSCVECGVSFWAERPRRRSNRYENCRRIYLKKTQNVAVEKKKNQGEGAFIGLGANAVD